MTDKKCQSCGSKDNLTNISGDLYVCSSCQSEFEQGSIDGPDPDELQPFHGIDFAEVSGEEWPSVMVENDQWMGAVGKQGFSPWGKSDHPDAAPEDDARWKWSIPDMWADKETVDNWVDKHPKLTGYAFIMQKENEPYSDEADPLAFVDGDDVRCPETGEVHPKFIEIINEIGGTYVDVSTSGAGLHAVYRGKLPDNIRQFSFDIDDEPWGANEDVPGIEVYDGKRICISTGQHVAGTPDDANEWDENVIDHLIDLHVDDSVKDSASHDTNVERPDMDDYTPSAVGNEETSDIRDVYHAVDRIEPSDLRLKASKVGEESTGWEMWDPSSYRSSSGGDSLHYNPGENVFYDQKNGQAFGVIGLYAAESKEIDITKPWEKLEGQDWWETIDLIRENERVEIPEFEPDEGRHVAQIPVGRIEQLSHEERRRYAKRHGVEWPEVDEVRQRLDDEVMDAMEDGEDVTIASPTGSGKTYTVGTKDWTCHPEVTDNQPVIHALPTKPARDEIYQDAVEELGEMNVKRLKGRTELCPVAAGRHDGEFSCPDGLRAKEYIDMMCDKVGVPFSVVHEWMHEHHPSGKMPCCHGDTECASKGQFEDIPRTESGDPTHDVIFCTHKFLMVPSLRLHTNIIIDEQPKYRDAVSKQRVRTAINQYLKISNAPFDSYSELVQGAKTRTVGTGQLTLSGDEATIGNEQMRSISDPEVIAEVARNADAYTVSAALDRDKLANYVWGKDDDRAVTVEDIGELVEEASDNRIAACVDAEKLISEALDEDPGIQWFKGNPDGHALAPAFCQAIWKAEETAGDRMHARVPYHPPRFDSEAYDSEGWNRIYVDVTLDDQYEIIEATSIPDFMLTRSVIGLDAHAQWNDPWWQVDVKPDIQTRNVLDTEEEMLYRRYERGLFVVQVGDNTQPVASGKYLDGGQGKRLDAIVGQLAFEYGDDFQSAISSTSGEEYLQESMKKHGIDDPKTMHYGEEESRNDFEGEKTGLVFGSHDFGDGPILDIAARLKLDVEPETVACQRCDDEDDGCTHCDHKGEVRAVGRGFEGHDAGTAERILHGWRERHVAQSVGRWARDAEDPNDNAVVYVATNAVPDNFVDAQVPGVKWMPTDDQADRIEYVMNNTDGVTAAEVAEATGCDKSTAYRTMKRLADEGRVECREGAGKYGAHIYEPNDTDEILSEVDFTDDGETVAPHVLNTYTWVAPIHASLRHSAAGEKVPEVITPSLGRYSRPVGADPPAD